MVHFFRTDGLGSPAFFEPRLTKAEQTEGLDATFTLELTAVGAVDISKGDHLIYKDDTGAVRDVVVVSPAVTHDSGGLVTSIVCKDRIAVDAADMFIEDQRNTQPTAVYAILDKLLANTPYQRLDKNTQTATISFYHEDLWTALCALSTATGLEIERTYTVDDSAYTNGTLIATAKIGFVKQLGDSSDEPRRFDYGADLTGVTRTINADPVYTCMYGFGKGLETDNGGYSRKLTFGSVNGGKNYVTIDDAAYARKWGIPDQLHGKNLYRIGTYENQDCEDAQQLLTETKAALATASQPSVTYELDTIVLEDGATTSAGTVRGPVHLGDSVAVVDGELGIRLSARVSKRVTDLLTGQTTITLGAQGESFTAQTQNAASSATAAATAAIATAQSAVATQADITPTVTRVVQSGDGWDTAATLASVILLEDGLPVISYDGEKYVFSPETGVFSKEQA